LLNKLIPKQNEFNIEQRSASYETKSLTCFVSRFI
jgi:hypothetical protein